MKRSRNVVEEEGGGTGLGLRPVVRMVDEFINSIPDAVPDVEPYDAEQQRVRDQDMKDHLSQLKRLLYNNLHVLALRGHLGRFCFEENHDLESSRLCDYVLRDQNVVNPQ